MIGLFIGSFNPITLAHIEICLKLKDKFSKIVLVPVNSREKELININTRIEMLNIIKNKYPFIEISDIMKNYSYLNYRIIDILSDEYEDINIIMGSDLLEKFTNFDNYEYLLDKYSYTIIPRNNTDLKKVINDKYKKYQDKFYILDYYNDVSSSMVRNNIKNNERIDNLLDKDILDYIKVKSLY